MFCYNYKRRSSREVKVAALGIGGDNPIRIQSMANTDTNDVSGSVAQAARMADAGAELIRFTTQGVREASSLGEIRSAMLESGIEVPVSADVHFNPNAAFRAAETADKVRINPGNFVDAARTFRKLEFTDEEYANEIIKIEEALVPFLEKCRDRKVAVRLGVNHGSLSDRIMSRYGDTPEGMVESVMEFLRVSRKINFHDIVISVKASNTSVMVRTVQLLVREMEREGMDYPLHLGVTEAGDAEDGRIKSAAGIGALLAEGLGDTIRVSLSEPPENELPVAAALRDYIAKRENHEPIAEPESVLDGASRERSRRLTGVTFPVSRHADGDVEGMRVVTTTHINKPGEVAAQIDRIQAEGEDAPILIELHYDTPDIEQLRIEAGADFGALLLNGYGSGIAIENPNFSTEELAELELAILQATRLRMSKTEYIACPSCGRTLFDLQSTLRDVKEATKELKGLKIGVMGCIVNGPGEMADADYGYVGAGPGRVSLYRGKELIRKNIPTEEALPALLDLIREDREA